MAKTVGRIIRTETPAEKHICPHCGKEYRSEDSLKKHIADKHSAESE